MDRLEWSSEGPKGASEGTHDAVAAGRKLERDEAGRSLGGLWERGRGPACVEEKREENQTVDMNRRGKV